MGFEWSYRQGTPPWDIGQPQPAVVALAEDGGFFGEVLDVGCGTGENALFLASRGLSVTGVDAAPTAIKRAREKAERRQVAVRFEVGDALDLPAVGRTFDSVVDCGLFHTFDDRSRRLFERSLRSVLRPGARYNLLCFSDEEPGDWGPRRITQAEIRSCFARGWRIDSIVGTRFSTVDPVDGSWAPRAWLAALTRLPDGE